MQPLPIEDAAHAAVREHGHDSTDGFQGDAREKGNKKGDLKTYSLGFIKKGETFGNNIKATIPEGFPPSWASIQSAEEFGFEICLLGSETSCRLENTPNREAA